MKELRCGRRDCNFNRGYECRAQSISVDEAADCNTYDPDGRPVKNDNVMYEAGMDNYFADKLPHTSVDCMAHKCLFNRSEKCIANGISVVSEAKEAKCSSYIKS